MHACVRIALHMHSVCVQPFFMGAQHNLHRCQHQRQLRICPDRWALRCPVPVIWLQLQPVWTCHGMDAVPVSGRLVHTA